MDISMLAYVRARLAELKPVEFAVVADKAGVPISTIRKVHYNEVDDPRINTIQRLHDYFRGKATEADHAPDQHSEAA